MMQTGEGCPGNGGEEEDEIRQDPKGARVRLARILFSSISRYHLPFAAPDLVLHLKTSLKSYRRVRIVIPARWTYEMLQMYSMHP